MSGSQYRRPGEVLPGHLGDRFGPAGPQGRCLEFMLTGTLSSGNIGRKRESWREPDMAVKTLAASMTVFASSPTLSCHSFPIKTPDLDTRPEVGFKPTTPELLVGFAMLPSICLASARGFGGWSGQSSNEPLSLEQLLQALTQRLGRCQWMNHLGLAGHEKCQQPCCQQETTHSGNL